VVEIGSLQRARAKRPQQANQRIGCDVKFLFFFPPSLLLYRLQAATNDASFLVRGFLSLLITTQ